MQSDAAERIGRAMADILKRRGPDRQDVWTDAARGLILVHTRLSVIDLSDAAGQPFFSPDGRFVLVYNGEIYNFKQLRIELEAEGEAFRTNSDTEVLLLACRRWGVLAAVKKFIGMFAFALWDAAEENLWLARDPVGIKPLYYGVQGSSLIFSSTLAACRLHPDFKGQISSSALAAFFRYSYVPGPLSIYEGIKKLPPGHVLSVDAQGNQSLRAYWSARDAARAGLAQRRKASDADLLTEFEALVRDSVRGCLISDVPLGAFLSGGIDSSLLVALMRQESAGSVRSFTIGFKDARFDESEYARRVAKHLGSDHTEVICTADDAKVFIPDLPIYCDEPFADSSQIPTLLLSKLTRQSVTVSLSGDGGDELFGGYDRYYWMESLRQLDRSCPDAVLAALARLAEKYPRNVTYPLLRRFQRGNALIPKLDRIYHLLRMATHFDDRKYLYQTTPMTVCARRDGPLLRDEAEPASVLDDGTLAAEVSDVIDWMMSVDQQTYLPDDILQKTDRASMAFSLEARVPFLDHRLIEFSWRVPQHLKLRHGRGKILMRQLLAKSLPQDLIERPKRGFSIPLSDWLKGDLRPWAEAVINDGLAGGTDLLDVERARRTWENFLTGRAEHTLTTIWNLLSFLHWKLHLPKNSMVITSS